MLDLDRFQTRQLAQADFQDVFGLAVAQFEALDQGGFGLVALTDDRDHLVNIEQHQLPSFQNMDAVEHLVQTVLRATQNCRLAELDPLGEHIAHRLLHRASIDAHHRQVDRR